MVARWHPSVNLVPHPQLRRTIANLASDVVIATPLKKYEHPIGSKEL